MSYLFDCYAGIYDGFMKMFHLHNTSKLMDCIIGSHLSVLDVGGGSGTMADELQQRHHQVIVVDPSAAMLKQAYKKNKNLKLIHSTLDDLPEMDQVDVVLCRDCLHHLANTKKAVECMMKLTKDDGMLLIYDFQPNTFRIKALFLFERCCLEKIHPVYPRDLKALASTYQISFLHQGKWDYICQIKKRI